MAEKKLSKEALRKTCLRTLTFHRITNSLEYLYGCGTGYGMMPVLQELYGDDEEKLKEAAKRHYTPYISEMNLGNCIIGAAVAMEEERANGGDVPAELITATKNSLMGPFAGFGDTLLFGTLAPVIRTIFLAFAMEGMVIGCFGEVVERVICLVLGIYTFYKGYDAGRNSLINILKDERVEQIMTGAAVLGMIMMGSMAAQYTTVSTSLVYTINGKQFNLQSQIDSLMPGLLPFVTLILIYRYMSKGGNYIKLLLFVLVICILGGVIGIF